MKRILRRAIAVLAIFGSLGVLAPGIAHAEGDLLYIGCSVETPNNPGALLYGGCLAPGVAASGTGTAGLYSCSSVVVAVSATGSSCAAPSGWVRVSDLYPWIDPGDSGYLDIPGVGRVPYGGYTALLPGSLILNLSGIAISGTGTASSDWIAISATNRAYAPITISPYTDYTVYVARYEDILQSCIDEEVGDWQECVEYIRAGIYP